MNREARWEIVQRNGGWIARLRGANGRVVASSTSQLYAKERDAVRVVEIAVEAGGARVYRDERYVPPPVVLEHPLYVSNPAHYEREGRRVTVTHPDFWHDREYHWRQCSGDDCREETPPAGTEVRSRMGSARYAP